MKYSNLSNDYQYWITIMGVQEELPSSKQTTPYVPLNGLWLTSDLM